MLTVSLLPSGKSEFSFYKFSHALYIVYRSGWSTCIHILDPERNRLFKAILVEFDKSQEYQLTSLDCVAILEAIPYSIEGEIADKLKSLIEASFVMD